MNLIFNAHSLEEYPQWKLQEFKPFIAQSTTPVIDLYMLQEAHLKTGLHAQQPPNSNSSDPNLAEKINSGLVSEMKGKLFL